MFRNKLHCIALSFGASNLIIKIVPLLAVYFKSTAFVPDRRLLQFKLRLFVENVSVEIVCVSSSTCEPPDSAFRAI